MPYYLLPLPHSYEKTQSFGFAIERLTTDSLLYSQYSGGSLLLFFSFYLTSLLFFGHNKI